jgi:hypothetical protein
VWWGVGVCGGGLVCVPLLWDSVPPLLVAGLTCVVVEAETCALTVLGLVLPRQCMHIGKGA